MPKANKDLSVYLTMVYIAMCQNTNFCAVWYIIHHNGEIYQTRSLTHYS